MATATFIHTAPRPTYTFAWLSNNLDFDQTARQPTLVATLNDWNLNTTVAQPLLMAETLTGEVISFSEVIVKPQLVAQLISGRSLTLQQQIRRPHLTALITVEQHYYLSHVIVRPSLSASIMLDSVYTLNKIISNISLISSWINDVFNVPPTTPGGTDYPDVKTYVMNTLNGAHSEYLNYGFNSYFKLANKYYGINRDGVYELTGNLDKTANIDAEVHVPISSYDVQGLKSCPDAIIFGRLSGDLELIAVLDEQEQREGFIVYNDGREGLHRIRVKIPKGLKGSTWQFKLKNVNGSQFNINNLEVFLHELQRVR